MKVPAIKKDESLAMWRKRLVREYNLSAMVEEILREVSITSYMKGSGAALNAINDSKNRNTHETTGETSYPSARKGKARD